MADGVGSELKDEIVSRQHAAVVAKAEVALTQEQFALFRADLLELMLQMSPAIALSDLSDAIARGQLKVFGTSIYGNGMHGGNRVVFDVRFSIEVLG